MTSFNKTAMVRQREFTPWALGNSLTTDANDDLRMAVGDAVVSEVGTLGIGGILLDDTTKTCNFIIPIPTHWDRLQQLRFSPVYSNDAATSGSVDLDLFYDSLAFNALIGALPTSGTLASSPDAVSHSGITANSMFIHGPYVIAPATFNDQQYFLRVSIKRKVSGSTMDIKVFGLQVEYSPKFYKGYKPESPAWTSQ